MGRAAKAILVIIGIVGVFVIGGIGIVVYLVTQDGGEFLRDQQTVVNEGGRFGADTDDVGCIEEATRRLEKEGGFGGGFKAVLFLQHCLKPATKTDAFCEGVPNPFELIDSGAYQQKQCNDSGLGNNPFCASLFSEVQQECYRR